LRKRKNKLKEKKEQKHKKKKEQTREEERTETQEEERNKLDRTREQTPEEERPNSRRRKNLSVILISRCLLTVCSPISFRGGSSTFLFRFNLFFAAKKVNVKELRL
jgi:hypothetical protein